MEPGLGVGPKGERVAGVGARLTLGDGFRVAVGRGRVKKGGWLFVDAGGGEDDWLVGARDGGHAPGRGSSRRGILVGWRIRGGKFSARSTTDVCLRSELQR